MVKPRTFATPAFLEQLDERHYGLFRNIEVEEMDESRGYPIRRFLRKAGPMRILKEAGPDERDKIVMRSHHPSQNRPLDLVEVPNASLDDLK